MNGPRVPAGSDDSRNYPAGSPGRGAQPAGVFTPRPEEYDDEIDLRDIWGTMRRRWRTVAVTLAVVVAGALAWSLWVAPVWYARTLIRVDDPDGGRVPSLGALSVLTTLQNSSQIETEMRILQTRPVGEQVVDDLDLNFVVRRPAGIPRMDLFRSLDFGRGTMEGT